MWEERDSLTGELLSKKGLRFDDFGKLSVYLGCKDIKLGGSLSESMLWRESQGADRTTFG